MRRWRMPLIAVTMVLAAVRIAVLAVGASGKNSLESVDTLYETYREDFPEVRDVSVVKLLQQNLQNVVLVDVRDSVEREISSIPGSISQEEFERRPQRSDGELIVPFCTIGYRSGLYTQKLMQQGRNARNLRGGILAWCHAEQPVVANDKPTHRVHVYGRKWNLLPSSYEGVW
ncbi:rhodanese-like domain-containing protein [Fuerstiella marisgermanici]|nr:rhodanese-like domain-containing protein [Fuerstiella marisgermanici]